MHELSWICYSKTETRRHTEIWAFALKPSWANARLLSSVSSGFVVFHFILDSGKDRAALCVTYNTESDTELAIISTIAQENREMDYQEASRYPISGLPFHESEWSSLPLSVSMKVIFAITVSSKDKLPHTQWKQEGGYELCGMFHM